MTYMNTLPDDVLPLLAAGSNELLAALRRVSRLFAAVCALPPLERCGDLIRRGKFSIDLSSKHDKVLGAPVLDADDVAVLWEILGNKIGSAGAYKSVVLCKNSPIDIKLLSGRHHGGRLIEQADGTEIWMNTHGTYIEFNRPGCSYVIGILQLWYKGRTSRCVAVDTSHGRFYWAGTRKMIDLVAEHVVSTLIVRLRRHR